MRSLTLADICTYPVFTVEGDTFLSSLLEEMQKRTISAVIVVEGRLPVGIFTERDAVSLACAQSDLNTLRVSEVMSTPLLTASLLTDFQEAYELLQKHQIRHLVVVDMQGCLAGIVTEYDFLQYLTPEYLVSPKSVASVMSRAVLSMPETSALEEVVGLMQRKHISCVVIERESVPVGIFTERDLVNLEGADNRLMLSSPISEVMTSPVITMRSEETLEGAIRIMSRHSIRRILILDQQGRTAGIVTQHDLVEQLRDQYSAQLQKRLKEREQELEDLRNELELARKLNRAREELNEKELRYQHLIEHINHGVAVLGAVDDGHDFVLKDNNPAGERILGLANAQALGGLLTQLFPGFYQMGLLDVLQRVWQSGNSEHFPAAQYQDERLMVWLDTYIYRTPEDELLVVYEDLTQARQAELALHESEARYHGYFYSANNAIFLIDPHNDLILDANPRACELLGYPHAELLETPISTIHGHEMAEMDIFSRQVLATGSAVSEEMSCRTREGQFVPAIISGAAIPYEGRTVVLATVQDISARKRVEAELARAGMEWTQALDQFDDVVYLIDNSRRLVRANSAFYHMVGKGRDVCVGEHIVELLHPHLAETQCPVCEAQISKRETTLTLEPEDAHNPSGSPLEVSNRLVRNAAQQVTGQLVALRDLTQRRQIEAHQRLATSVFENTSEGVVVTDVLGNIVEVNRAFTDILGYSKEEVVGRNPRIWKSGRHDRDFYRNMWKSLLEAGYWRGEVWNRRKDGALVPEWQSITCVKDDFGETTHYVSVFSDITHIKQSQQKLDYLAHHDALTGLPNRLLLTERLEHSIHRASREKAQLAVLSLDVDNFKNINDSLGHRVGDQLLQHMAKRFLQVMRVSDTVARIGGDEFLFFLEDVRRPEDALLTAQKLIDQCSQVFPLDQRDLMITVSIGLCMYPQDASDTEMLLRNADAAMYRAKEQGRNSCQFYTPELTSTAMERVVLETSLRQCIEREELLLRYQPQICLHTGRVVGVEALSRWQHPEFGNVSPERFLRIAEESGLIESLGRWALREACNQGVRWLKAGVDFGRVAVNIAGTHLRRHSLLEDVVTVLMETGLPPDRLELEVTEDFIMHQHEDTVDQLHEIRALGIELAIDDFGTGYSSLSHLKQLPINKLKIDKAFVRELPGNADDRAIIEAVVALGKALSLTVLAEGAEQDDQVSFLQQAGCDQIQGFFYSQALSAASLAAYIKRSQK